MVVTALIFRARAHGPRMKRQPPTANPASPEPNP